MPAIKKFLKSLGPGIITGAADDDPSGIATYTQAGAKFGLGQLWLSLYMLPLQTGVQDACARIGAVTGKGLANVIKHHYGSLLVYILVFFVCITNIINIAADIGAMAAASQLLFPINQLILTIIFVVIMVTLQIFVNYRHYINILKWLVIALLGYPITLIMSNAPWLSLFKAAVIPHIELNYQFLFILTGVLGTTISPYLFFWQAAQEVEERNDKENHSKGKSIITAKYLHAIRVDNIIGMFFSQFSAWCMIAVGATVLNTHGVTDIKTAAEAAKALEPIMGNNALGGLIAKIIFAVGIIGVGLLSIPVLAGSAAYAIADSLEWKRGLNEKWYEAKSFYSVIVITTVLGISINFIPVDPFKLLIYTAVINGIVAVPLIFMISLISSNKKIMGQHTNGKWVNISLWITFICMFAAAGIMMLQFFRS